MAKKKKTPEAKAPLRGLQDTPTNTNSYIMHDPDHELAMKVTDGAVDGVWLDGEELGGGGGGDLSTAKVTLINSGGEDTSIYMLDGSPWIYDDELSSEGYTVYTTAIIDLILYQGSAHINIDNWDSEIDPVITGSCTWDSVSFLFEITGDCSITLKGHGGEE